MAAQIVICSFITEYLGAYPEEEISARVCLQLALLPSILYANLETSSNVKGNTCSRYVAPLSHRG